MKIAVTSRTTSMDGEVDPRFGRAAYFIIYDTESDEFKAIDNAQNLNAMQGAGIQAAETVVSEGVDAVITGHCGPKAFRTLTAAGIRIFSGASGTIREALDEYSKGKLNETGAPDVQGHWY